MLQGESGLRVGQYRPEERLALFFAVDDQPTTEADGLDHRLLQTRKHRIDDGPTGVIVELPHAIDATVKRRLAAQSSPPRRCCRSTGRRTA